MEPKNLYYQKRGAELVRALQRRHFGAVYCDTREEALQAALQLIEKEDTVSWGGALSAKQIGLMDALEAGGYHTIDHSLCATPEEQRRKDMQSMFCDDFICGANAISMTGEMVSIDGNGNRVAAIVFGPRKVIVIAGMNKVVDTLADAVQRARTVAAPMNKQRFPGKPTPCLATGVCADCLSEGCICNQILITRNSRIPGRIQFVLVGEELGM